MFPYGTLRVLFSRMKFQRILALTDLSPHSVTGLTLANHLAARCGAKVTVGYAHTESEGLKRYAGSERENVDRLAAWVREEDESQLQILARENVDPLRLATVSFVEAENAREGVDKLIAKSKPDVVCMATHGRSGLKHMLLGSVAEHAIRSAGVPVMVTREKQLPPHGSPLTVHLAVDLMRDPSVMTRQVAEWMGPNDQVRLVHVIESAYVAPVLYGPDAVFSQPDRAVLTRAARTQLEAVSLDGSAAPSLVFDVRHGRPRQEILDAAAAEDASLVVVETHGRTGFDRLMLGSVAEFIVRRSKQPVLVIPAKA